MKPSGRITIKHVAQAAGVSTQTVSRVLNARPDVASETRQHIEAIIAKMGYRPSALARSLIRRRSYALGVVTAGLKFMGPSRTLNGIAQQAESLGYSLLLKELAHFETEGAENVLQALLDNQVDGILWAAPEIGANRAWLQDHLPQLAVPIVFLTMQPQPELTVVTIDNYLGGCLATQHLLDQGYQRIAHLAGPLDWWEARQRKQGWEDTLAQAGLPPTPAQVVEGNWSSASAEPAFQKLLAQYPEMDAVFVANDQMALSVLQAACQHKLDVPHRLGVVGFDGLPESAYFWPPLTTVDQDQNRLGCQAVLDLVQAIETRQQNQPGPEPHLTVIQPQLIVRQSSQKQTIPNQLTIQTI